MLRPIDIVTGLLDPTKDHIALIEEAWRSDSDEFFVGLDLATNPDYNYGLIKVPKIDDEDDDPGELTFSMFYNLAMNLHHGDIIGDAAKKAVQRAALIANVTEWNLWYRRILLKSLGNHLPLHTIQSTLIRLTTE